MSAKKHLVRISTEECKGCRRCISACPKKLLQVGGEINSQGYFAIQAQNPENCIGCGACFHQCPEPGAITILEIEE